MVILGFFFYLGLLLQPFTNHMIAGEGGGNSFNSSLPLSPASQTLSHYPSDYCIKLTSAHRQQPDLHRAPLISERKSLTTKQRLVSQWMTSKIRLKRAFTEKKTSIFFIISEAVVQRCAVKRCSQKFSKIHLKTPVLQSFFDKVAGGTSTLLKKRHWHRCFPVYFGKFQKQFFYRTLNVATSVIF